MSGSRRAPGEGTWERLPSGKWRLITKQAGRKIAGPAAPTKQEAKRLLTEKLRNAAKDARSQPSFGILAHDWLTAAKKRLSPTTYETYRFWLQALLSDPIATLPPSSITSTAILAWRERQDLAPVTIRKREGWIRQLLRSAGHTVTLKPVQVQDSKRRPLDPAERAVLMDRLETSGDQMRLAVYLCCQLGLRRSEAIALMHEDRSGDGVWIRRRVVRTSGTVYVQDATKTARSSAWIPLPEVLKPLIGQGTGFVLGDGKTPLHPAKLSRMIKAFAAGTILERIPRMGAHALRRTFGMMLLESGVDIRTAAELMRHDPAMLMRDYARSRDDLKIEAMERAFGAHTEPTREGNGT